jgi:galactonate dehydratase
MVSLTLVHSDIEQIWQTTWRIGFYRGGPVFMSALAGIDIALWDLKGTDLFSIGSSSF